MDLSGSAPDPLRSGAIFKVQDFEALRSPVPKVTLGGLTDGPQSAGILPRAMPALPAASPASKDEGDPGVSQDFESLCSKSPYPKLTMMSGMQQPLSELMPPPPPKQPHTPASPLGVSRAATSTTPGSRAGPTTAVAHGTPTAPAVPLSQGFVDTPPDTRQIMG